MSQEIVDAVRALAREKGIAEDKLITALEDALLSAYKKQPDAVKYARVHLDPDLGEYRVEELILPEELEDQLLDEAEEQATGELERRVDPETGEVIIPEAPEIAPLRLAEFDDQIEKRDGVGELITGIVQQSDSRYTLVQLRERVEALLPKSEQVDGERYDHSQR